MTHEHLSDELLQRHFDGELEPGEQTGVRQALSECASCNARLESLDKLSRLIRMATRDAEDAASDADFNGMFARIERATQESAPGSSGRVIHPTGAAHSKWFRPAVMSAVGALAVAAAVLLMVSRPESNPTDETYDDQADGTLAALETSHSEITHVDFGPNAGAVFDIAYDDGSSTPVVWIDDDDDSEE
jgi:anti-sigma factor RsiW